MKINNEEKKRLQSIIRKTGLVLGAGVAYAIFVSLTGWGIPCVFYLLTEKHCPGCGVSRMFFALLKLDFVAAARFNLFVLCMLPCALALFFYKARQYVKYGNTKMGMIEKVFYCVAVVLCIVFCILRNTGTVPFLIMPR